MSRYFFITCLCTPIGGEGTKCTGFIRIDSTKIKTDADFVGMIQEYFDIAPINIPGNRMSITNSIGKTPMPAPTFKEKYRPMTVEIYCMLDITDSPKGLFTIQFDAYDTGIYGRKTSKNVVMRIDFDDIENSSQLKMMAMEAYNSTRNGTYHVDVRKGCFITSMTLLGD